MNECKQCNVIFCTCVERNGDVMAYAEQILKHFKHSAWKLHYGTISDKGAMLCHIGTCEICGKALCMGARIISREGDFLADLYWVYYRQWSMLNPDSVQVDSFPDQFMKLFNTDDMDKVGLWLQQPSHQHSILIKGE